MDDIKKYGQNSDNDKLKMPINLVKKGKNDIFLPLISEK